MGAEASPAARTGTPGIALGQVTAGQVTVGLGSTYAGVVIQTASVGGMGLRHRLGVLGRVSPLGSRAPWRGRLP
jgi:hypothetical protein